MQLDSDELNDPLWTNTIGMNVPVVLAPRQRPDVWASISQVQSMSHDGIELFTRGKIA